MRNKVVREKPSGLHTSVSLGHYAELTKSEIKKQIAKRKNYLEQVKYPAKKMHNTNLLWIFVSLAIFSGGIVSCLWLRQNNPPMPINNTAKTIQQN